MDDDLDAGLLNIGLSDDAADSLSGAAPDSAAGRSRAEKTAQSEADFEAVRAAYRPKVENGELWKTARGPAGGGDRPVSKAEAQQLVHAVEELYFLRQFGEAAAFAQGLLAGDTVGLDAETRDLLRIYERMAVEKTEKTKKADGK